MMTRNEAEARAKRIWGERVVRVSQFRPDGIYWDIELRDDKHQHVLDANGHTACHADCEKLEARGTDDIARDAFQQRAQAATQALAEVNREIIEQIDALSLGVASIVADVAAIRETFAAMRRDMDAMRYEIGELRRLVAPVSPPDREDDDIRF